MAAASILIVEDEAIVALDIERTLRKRGYQVSGIAGSGAEAVLLARQYRPDVVLMDVRLRGEMDGIEAARHITEERETPLVFLTAFSDRETLQRAKAARPFAYLLKPFDEATLTANIEIALHNHHKAPTSTPGENALRLNETHFQQLIEHAKDSAIQLLDPVGEIRSWSAGAEQIYGWSPAEVLGKNCAVLYPPGDVATRQPDRQMTTAARAGLYSGYGSQVRKDNSQFSAEVLVLALTNPNGTIAGFLRITRRLALGDGN